MKSKKLNTEERQLHDKLESFEVPYNPEHWKEMESMLSNRPATGSSASGALKVASILVLLGSVAYFLLLDYTKNNHQAEVMPEGKVKMEKIQKPSQQEIAIVADSTELQELVEAKEIIELDTLAQAESDSLNVVDHEDYGNELFEDTENENSSTAILPLQNDSAVGLEIIAPNKVCLYNSILFKVKNRSAFDKINWKVNGKIFSGEYQFFEPGSYQIIAQAISNNQIQRDTLNISVLPEAEFDFTYEQLEGVFNDFTVKFNSDSKTELKWLIQGKTITGKDPLYNFKKEGLYDVTAYHINENGCSTELYKPVAVMKDFHFYSPDAFTPNGDGLNDVFLPPVLEDIGYNYEFMVFELSGTEVFSSSQKGEGWNGKLHNNGPKMPIGNYVWKVIIKSDDGKERRFTGSIKIVELD